MLSFPSKIPKTSDVQIKPVSLTCKDLGTHSVYFQINGSHELVASGIKAKHPGEEISLKVLTPYKAQLQDVEDALTIEIYNGKELDSSGTVSAFYDFENLVADRKTSKNVFAPQTLE